MIYVNKTEIPEQDFIDLLESTKEIILADFKTNGIPPDIDGLRFEKHVYDSMVEASKQTVFENKIKHTGAHAFPDIVANDFYGVEIKMTSSNKWISTGNSILETTRVDDIGTIYIFFGKLGNTFDIKFRKYSECLSGIGVTHSPRYKINMELPMGESIFDKMGVKYDDFRSSKDQIDDLKSHYRKSLKPGEELWWMDSESDERTVSPIIVPFRTLDKDIQERFFNEALVLFPEIFGKSKTKYEKLATYLITEYNSVSSHIRDQFSSSGKETIRTTEGEIEVPQLVYKLFINASKIKEAINFIPIDKLHQYWGIQTDEDSLKVWKKLVSEQIKKPFQSDTGKEISVEEIFELGLTN